MERIVIWGTIERTAMYINWLFDMYRVLAIVSDNNQKGKYHRINVIDSGEFKNYDFDKIVITLENNDVERAIHDICKIDEKYKEKIVTLDQISAGSEGVEGYFDYTSKRQMKVIDEILNASDEDISDYDWMIKRVKQYGIFCFQEDWLKEDDDICWAVYGLQQLPEEFASFCNYISKLEVKSAIEIGVYRGRSSFFICSVLARKNEKLIYKLVDTCDRIDDFGKFKEILPQLEKCIPSCSEDYEKQNFDFVFIDADHSYDASINDYNNVGQYGGIITAFHDIYAHEYDHENGGTVRMWKEVVERTGEKKHVLFSKYPDEWMGIGAVIMK